MDARVVYVTCKDEEEALRVARAVVENRLAACANLLPGMKSMYWWNGEIVSDTECVLILKSRVGLIGALTEKIKENHSYTVPCIVTLPVMEGNPDYLAWISRETGA